MSSWKEFTSRYVRNVDFKTVKNAKREVGYQHEFLRSNNPNEAHGFTVQKCSDWLSRWWLGSGGLMHNYQICETNKAAPLLYQRKTEMNIYINN